VLSRLAAHPAPSRVDLRVDAAIAVAVFAASLGLLAAGDTDLGNHSGDVDALATALTALASLPLVARRLAPLPVFVLTALASTALFGLAGPAGPPIGPTIALYTVAATADESAVDRRLTFGVVAVMLAAHLTATGLAMGSFPGTQSVLAVCVWGGAWLAGERTRLRVDRMAELEERAASAERDAQRERRLAAAEERMRIARDLHDSAGHAINVILVHAGLGRLRVERDPASAHAAFATIEEVARETVGEIDQMVRVLRDDRPREAGDVEPPPGVAALEGLVDRHRAAGLAVTSSIRGDRRPLSPGVDQGAYRIVQEALTNALKHAGPATACVLVRYGSEDLEVEVTDTGRRPAGGDGAGHGLVGMRERVTLFGGQLEAGRRGEGGFVVRARLPLASERP
jgi:signal transduction histidine kinase